MKEGGLSPHVSHIIHFSERNENKDSGRESSYLNQNIIWYNYRTYMKYSETCL